MFHWCSFTGSATEEEMVPQLHSTASFIAHKVMKESACPRANALRDEESESIFVCVDTLKAVIEQRLHSHLFGVHFQELNG